MKAMKKNYWNMMVCATTLGMVMAGCSNEDDLINGKTNTNETGIGISRITAGMPQGNPSTRLIYEDGANGGLNVKWNADNANPESFLAVCYPTENNTSNYAYGVKFVQEVGADEQASTSTTFKSQRWGDTGFVDGNFNGTIQAIYPAKDSYVDCYKIKDISSTQSSIQVTLPLTGQTGKRTDMASFDYMTAEGTATADEAGDASLNLKFKRRIAVMRIKGLTFPAGVTGNVTEIKLSGSNLVSNISMNLAKNNLEFNSANPESITTTGTFSIGIDRKLTEDVYICFLPLNANASGTNEITGLTIHATVGGVVYKYSYGEDAAATKVTKFVEGNMYTLSDKVMTILPSFENENSVDGATENNAYLIKGYDQLQLFAQRMNGSESTTWNTKFYKLAENIVIPDNGTWTPINNFSGSFDGDGKEISELKDRLFIKVTGTANKSAIVKNLNVACNLNLQNSESGGGISGDIEYCNITNCRVSGSIQGNGYIAGIAGTPKQTCIIENCHNSANISGFQSAYGITGSCYMGATLTIIACSNSGNLSTSNTNSLIAGIAGKDTYGTTRIYGCFNTGTLTHTYYGVTGITPKVTLTKACYNTGIISYATSNNNNNGAISNQSAGVEDCYYLSSSIAGTAGTDYAESGTAVSVIDYAALNAAWASDTYQFNTTTGAIELKNP